MRIYKPQNEFGQDLLSNGDLVNSTKTITKTIADGKVEIAAADLGTDKPSDWTVIEVVYEGNKIMAEVFSTDDKITVTLDDAGSTFSGDVMVTLNYEKSMNISQEAQEAPVMTHAEIRGLVDGTSLFHNGPIDVWDCDLPDLENGLSMFAASTILTSFRGDMQSLKYGGTARSSVISDGMFAKCSNLIQFSGDMPSLIKGRFMFTKCVNLTSFSGKMTNISDVYGMFNGCSNLSSFSSDLPSLGQGDTMFWNCYNLHSFSSDVSAMTDGQYMFYECTDLTSFSADLPALSFGSHMFEQTKLDLESVMRIANSIPAYEQGENHPLTIGVNSTLVTEEQQDEANTIMVNKGWQITWQRN